MALASDIIGLQSYRIRWKKRKIRTITPFKVIHGHQGRYTNRKPVCDVLLVINSNWHPISYRFGVIAAYCSNFGHLAFLSPLWRRGAYRELQCSSWAYWIARSGLPISVNLSFFPWLLPNYSSQKTRLNDLSYGIKIWTDLSSVLSQSTRLTDRRTDRILIARQRLHCMQRGKKLYASDFTLSQDKTCDQWHSLVSNATNSATHINRLNLLSSCHLPQRHLFCHEILNSSCIKHQKIV